VDVLPGNIETPRRDKPMDCEGKHKYLFCLYIYIYVYMYIHIYVYLDSYLSLCTVLLVVLMDGGEWKSHFTFSVLAVTERLVTSFCFSFLEMEDGAISCAF